MRDGAARRHVRRPDQVGGVDARGSLVCSNAAPQHAMWADEDLQRECNALLRKG
ncbi:hypothetical protein K3N28_00010 [Glycomyces sp. TRM65418]|uniref:hypothetical protein n=1 Tax=Glycomyces sp. TRM65418 TaxID=2867006 RepID=UPI001CE54514|nr:hypothetical protein [Glycomyces sp. TRM65418]MCC3761463.1 hypothetical protein [Glycomyces sp. TRM65418]QZD55563.1 hypothetical protein K3N28_00015 [Glycomyces sp. TRM65418]